MSVEFRVAVPQGSRDTFEKAIGRIKGVSVLAVKASKESVVKRHLDKHKKILRKVQEPKSPEVQAKIDRGFQQLLKDVVAKTKRYDEKSISQSEKLDAVTFKSIVMELFERSMESQPRNVDTVRNRVGWESSPSPLQMQALIYRYGLLDGEIKTNVGTYRAMGYSAHSGHYALLGGLHTVGNNLRKRGFITVT